jgi:hypothetical protein
MPKSGSNRSNADSKLKYSRAELLDDHTFARPHMVAGKSLHGGFDDKGAYVPPRSRTRNVALDAWTHALRARGGDLLDAEASLLDGPRLPNAAQQRLLVREGITRPFFNALTITGKIEGRGRMLASVPFPDLQDVIVEDISSLALGHLNGGLLWAHGIDEGGEPERGIGGHDVMWFAARDLVFEPGSHPDVEPPANIARPEAGMRLIPELDPVYEGYLSLLMNLLIIEFRAEIGFASTQVVFRSPDLFTERRAAAEEAAEIIERIRTDEEIHVRSLRLYLGELRELTFRTQGGGTLAGASIIDRFWDGLVAWATVEQPRLAAQSQYEVLKPQIVSHPDGARILREFDALGDAQPGLASAG